MPGASQITTGLVRRSFSGATQITGISGPTIVESEGVLSGLGVSATAAPKSVAEARAPKMIVRRLTFIGLTPHMVPSNKLALHRYPDNRRKGYLADFHPGKAISLPAGNGKGNRRLSVLSCPVV